VAVSPVDAAWYTASSLVAPWPAVEVFPPRQPAVTRKTIRPRWSARFEITFSISTLPRRTVNGRRAESVPRDNRVRRR
jgi:hypothetical protein